MASRSIGDLDFRVRRKCVEWLGLCKERGVTPLVYCTYRSPEDQDALYAIGRTEPGKKRTNLKGGQSLHNHMDAQKRPASLAFDAVPMIHGKAMWEGPDAERAYETMGQIWTSLGGTWGGSWEAFPDQCHFQLDVH